MIQQKSPVIQLSDFQKEYTLKVKNELIMGKENPIRSLETNSQILLDQKIENHKIINKITTEEIKGNTKDEYFKPFLLQSLQLSDISKTLVIERSSEGEIKNILNLSQLKTEWERWKDHKLQSFISEDTQRHKFIQAYELGLNKMNENIRNNIQYSFLLPEIYYLDHLSSQNLPTTPPYNYTSRLVTQMNIQYSLYLKKMQYEDDNPDILNIELQNKICNSKEMVSYLKKLYDAQTEFSIQEYTFGVFTNYKIDKNTGKLLTGKASVFEKMHEHLQYKIEIILEEA